MKCINLWEILSLSTQPSHHLLKRILFLALSNPSLPQAYMEIFIFPKPILGLNLETGCNPDETVKKKRREKKKKKQETK